MNLKNIFKSYGKQKVFEDFSLEIKEGGILCLLGESGGGKTTLLNIFADLTSFEGVKEGVPRDISYVFQEPRLLPNLTVWENLSFVGGKEEAIKKLLEDTELSNLADKRPTMLSGGEKQRVALARAFCVPFSLLLMDEPFSSLDTGLKIRLLNVFARLWQERKAQGQTPTAIFVTHDLEEALMIADRIVVLKGGKIVGDFSVERTEFPAPYGKESELKEQILSLLLS